MALRSPLVLGAFLVSLAACGPAGFDSESLINSVRILASRSDQPYAKPGATVHSEVLAVDGRPDAGGSEPMRVFWLPFLCVNPPNDAYYACFSQFEAASTNVDQQDAGGPASLSGSISTWDGGADAAVARGGGDGGGLSFPEGGSLASIPSGEDISAFLIQGSRAVFNLPSDIVSAHAVTAGAIPYGVAIAFNIACAGHIEIVPLDPTNPNPVQIPFGCFNAQHVALTADEYVIGYTEVFAYDSLSNQNPVIQSFTFRGQSVALEGSIDAGVLTTDAVAFPSCAGGAHVDCPANIATVGVPDASWERDPQNAGGPDGGPLGEQIWVDYYSTIGSIRDEAILVFDPMEGRVTAPKPEDLQSVTAKGKGMLWAVLHDNRGGASWLSVPLNAQ